MPTNLPSVFAAGYDKAKVLDPVLASAYVTHLRVGDPDADAVMTDLARLPPGLPGGAELLKAIVEQNDEVLRRAPQSVQDFAHRVGTLPAWYDRETARHGCRVFLSHPDQFLAAFAGGAIVEGFSTMISKSFALTGRMIDDGVRRLKQNLRHLLDMFLPRGIEPLGDGWKLTVRIRLVHARVRSLLKTSEEWDDDAWGTPVSSAHVSLAAAAFSARLLQLATKLGASLDHDEREAFMAVWSYAAHLMGVPEPLMFHSQAEGLRLYRVATTCEPPPDLDAVALAHCIVNSAPVVVGVGEPRARAAFAKYVYRVSRELVGDTVADRLRFPPRRSLSILPWLRSRERLRRWVARFFPAMGSAHRFESFTNVLRLADLGESEVSYHLPDQVRSDASRRW